MIGAIIQARMASVRLPGKVMREVLGKPLLFYLIERLKQSNRIEKIIVATSTSPTDEAIADYTESLGIECFRGSEDDVLDRYYRAALKFAIDTVVRITADCPLLCPKVADRVIKYYIEHQEYDLVRSGQTFPEGLDTEVLPFKSLKIAWKEARLSSEREHVTSFIWKNDKRFKVKTLIFEQDFSSLRITIDEEVDFYVIKSILERLYSSEKIFYLKDILELYKEEPEIFRLNRNVIRNEGYLKSLSEDKEISLKE